MITRDNFFLILHENIPCDPYLHRLVETVQVRGHNVVALLFYVHGKHLRSCRDGQLT